MPKRQSNKDGPQTQKKAKPSRLEIEPTGKYIVITKPFNRRGLDTSRSRRFKAHETFQVFREKYIDYHGMYVLTWGSKIGHWKPLEKSRDYINVSVAGHAPIKFPLNEYESTANIPSQNFVEWECGPVKFKQKLIGLIMRAMGSKDDNLYDEIWKFCFY